MWNSHKATDKTKMQSMSCAHEQRYWQNEKDCGPIPHIQFEKCVCCHARTDVPTELDIALRDCYVEGAGQLCRDCYYALYGKG